jgi:hypothetical protein
MWPSQPPNQRVPVSFSHRTRQPDREADLWTDEKLKTVEFYFHYTERLHDRQWSFLQRVKSFLGKDRPEGFQIISAMQWSTGPTWRSIESVHKSQEPFVLLLQSSSMGVIYRITYVFMMSSNIAADVRAGKQSLDRSVQNKIILKNKQIVPYDISIDIRSSL